MSSAQHARQGRCRATSGTILTAIIAAQAVFAAAVAEADFPQVLLQPVSQNELVAPVGMVNAGDGSNRMFFVDQRGKIQIMQNGSLLPTPFLDIGPDLVSARAGFDERGLLGLTFHPDYAVPNQPGTGKFYVYYSDPQHTTSGFDHRDVLAEYTVSSNPNIADPASKRIVLTNDHPQFNHDGGQLAFGPDRQLYMSIGDGGGSGDDDNGHTGNTTGTNQSPPNGFLGNAQDKSKLMGKILRIDPLGTNGPNGQYGIPADNPFVGQSGVRQEIYAYGLRNTWRFSFDDGPGGTGRLFAADVGQGSYEEINLIESGGNYGWRIREGFEPFDPTAPNPDGVTLIDPINVYGHEPPPEYGLSVTGGYVYRGTEFPELVGKYIYGDWSNAFSPGDGTLLGLEETSPGVWERTKLDVVGGNPIGLYITAFGEDELGNLYVVARSNLGPEQGTAPMPGGMIFKIVPEPGAASALLLLSAALLGRRRLLVANERPV
jgi:glucose/arabinose dehydrogenase